MGILLALIQISVLRVVVHRLIGQAYREMKELEAIRTLQLINATKLLNAATGLREPSGPSLVQPSVARQAGQGQRSPIRK
jgi:hypothetical protein